MIYILCVHSRTGGEQLVMYKLCRRPVKGKGERVERDKNNGLNLRFRLGVGYPQLPPVCYKVSVVS